MAILDFLRIAWKIIISFSNPDGGSHTIAQSYPISQPKYYTFGCQMNLENLTKKCIRYR